MSGRAPKRGRLFLKTFGFLYSPSLKCGFAAKRYSYLCALLVLGIITQGCDSRGSTGGMGSPTVPSSSTIQVPSSVSLVGTGSANTKSFSASENFYSGTMTQTNSCSPSAGVIATVSPVSGTAPVTFTVTPQAVGSCSITISDSNSQSATVAVTVTTESIVIQ